MATPSPPAASCARRGVDAIRAGQVAAFTVAGGQGTRLGWDAPKGTFPATPIRGSAVFVVAPAEASSVELMQLLDRLSEENLPSIVLSGQPRPGVRHASDEGPITLDLATPPTIVAAMLSALAHRQSVVNQLKTEVKIARRFQGGLRGEIDRIHEELQLAASVQREFLPRSLPHAPSIDIQILFRPAGYVSGDIYDVIRLDEHTLGFFVADAVGLGRLQGLALAAAGEAGVVRMLEIIETEIISTLGLLGVTSFAELDRTYITKATPILRPGPFPAFPLLKEGY